MPNKEIWNTIRDKVKQHPERLDMHFFSTRTSCGITYCIIGWAAKLGFIKNHSSFEFHKSIGLSSDSLRELKNLCFPSRWTNEEWDEYYEKKHLFVLRKMDEFWAKYGGN